MKEQLTSVLREIIQKHYGVVVDDLKLETPPKKELGDFAFGSFVLAKDLRKNPNLIAEELSELLAQNELITSAESQGPYINIKLSKNIFTDVFLTYLKDFKEDKLFVKKDRNIVVDYIGANVGKPMHIGHMCTPIVGQAMINVYKKIGYTVISDSHIGDWGIIFGKLITAYKLWGNEEKLKENAVEHLLELYIKVTAEAENDENLEVQTREVFKKLSEGDEEFMNLWKQFTSYSIKSMQVDLDRLHVKPDFNIGESFYEGLGLPKLEDYPDLEETMTDIVEELIKKGISIVNNDKSVGVEFNENTKIPSCILRKRDGTHGYLASDLTAIKYRIKNWSPEKIVYFVDVRQSLHFRQAFEISKQAGWLQNGTSLIHAHNGFISLKDGAMSTRKGKIIKLDLLFNEAEKRAKDIIISKGSDIKGEELDILSRKIGIGAIKYGYLKKSRESDIIFDWDEFMTFEGNSGPYIQYSYVRARKILEKYLDHTNGEKDFNLLKGANFEYDEETLLVKRLLDYKSVLLETAEKNMPHILCAYIYEITKLFSSLYNSVHILNEKDEGKKLLRVELVDLFAKTLKEGFDILAIELPERM